MDSPEASEQFDSSLYQIELNADKLRQPTNLELAGYVDLNNMSWFTAIKCMLIARDVMHSPEELMVAQLEMQAAQTMVLSWWHKLMEDEGLDNDEEV